MTKSIKKLNIINLTRIYIAIVLAVFIMFNSFGFVLAESTYELSYNVVDGKAYITGFAKSPDVFVELVIPSKIDSYPVAGVSDNAFSGSADIKSLKIEDGVLSIGANSFYNCTYLEYVDARYIKNMGASSFKGCTQLSHIEFGEGLNIIGQQAFYNCRKLQSIIIPSTVAKVDAGIFAQCRSLQTVVLLGKDTFTGSTFASTIGMDLSTPTHYYVRNENAKTTITSNGVSAENVTIISGNMLVLKDGYKQGIASVIDCGDTVTLPEYSRLRYNLKGWNDGINTYPAGSSFSISDFAVLEAVWSLDKNETERLSVKEFKEIIYNKNSTDELVRWDESDIVDNSLTLDVSVDEGNVVMDSNLQRLFGVQFEISGEKLVNGEKQLSDAYINSASNIGAIPVARWGGLYTNRVNLIKSVGPYAERGTWTSLNIENGTTETRGPIAYGPVEFIKTVLATNPDAEFVFVISMFDQTPAETAQFVHFLLDDKNSSQWGALRASMGLEEPVNVIGFELGNENYHSIGVTFPGFDEPFTAETAAEYYTETAMQHAQAIRGVSKDLKIMPVVVRESTPEKGMVWNRIVAKKLGAYIDDLVAVHFYSGNSTFRHKANDDIYTNIKQIFKDELGPDKDIKFAVTEHALTSEGNYVSYTSLWACLTDSLFFSNAMNNGDTALATYHNFYSNNLWSYVQDTGGEYIPTGIADFYNLYKTMLGDRVVKTTYNGYDGSDNSPEQYASVVAMATDDDQLTLVLTNASNYNEYTVNFDFVNEYDLVSETTFTAPNYYSYKNSENTKDVFTTTTVNKNTENFNSYTLGSKRVVFLKLKAKTPITTVEKTNPLAEEKDDVVYNDLLYGATAEENVYHFANAEKVRRIDYLGTSTNFKIYLKNISGVWEKFATSNSFENGKMLNVYNENVYTAIKVENADISDFTVLSEISGTTDIPFADSSFRLYPRIKGTDCFDSYSATVDSNYFIFENNEFKALKTGESKVTVGNCTINLNVYAEKEKFEFVEDFEAKEPVLVSGIGETFDNWIAYRTSGFAQLGIDNLSNYSQKTGKGLIIVPFCNGSSIDRSAVAYYNGDLSKLSDRYTINFDASRTHSSDNFGVRFMVHNDNNNYYQLQVEKYGALMSPAWVLYKVTDSQATELARGYTYGNRLGTGTITFKVTVNNGKISWKAYGNGDIYDEYCGEYVDENPFVFDGNKATFGFFGTYDGYMTETNAILVDNISVESLDVVDSAQYEVKNGLVYITAEDYDISKMPEKIGGYDIVYTDGEMYFASSVEAKNILSSSGIAAKNLTVVEAADVSETGDYKLSYALNPDKKSLAVTGFQVYPSSKYTLVIPDTAKFDADGDGTEEEYPVTAINDGAFAKGCNTTHKNYIVTYNEKILNDLITGLQIGKNVTTIGTLGSSYTGVFVYCPKLTYAVIPDNVTSFGKQVFFRSGLTSLEVGKGVTSMDYKALSTNKSLVALKLHTSNLHSGAFYGCGKIAELHILSDSLTVKNNKVFEGLSSGCVLYVKNASVKEYLVSCGYSTEKIIVLSSAIDFNAETNKISVTVKENIESADLIFAGYNGRMKELKVINVKNLVAGETCYYDFPFTYNPSGKYKIFLFNSISDSVPLLPLLEIN